MKDIQVSIIIPVYNAQEYIEKCVSSLLKQTHENFELLLIVDGATDRSLEICNQLRLRDPRIQVVNKPNEGVSATRNLGIAMAKGAYICFVDADDAVTEDYLEALLTAVTANDAQMALCQYVFERQDSIAPSGEPELVAYDRQTDSLYETYIRSFYRIHRAPYRIASICRSIFKKELLTQNGLLFPPCKLYEDQLFLLSAMACCEKIAAVNRAMYYYNDVVSDSAVRKPYKANLLKDQTVYLEQLKQRLPGLPISEQQRRRVWQYAVLNIRKLLLTNGAMHPDKKERRKEITCIRGSEVFSERVPMAVYWQWLRSQPVKTAVAELLLQLRMYDLLNKLRS